MEKKAPKLCNERTCTGCGACENACPVNAISMTYKEGFKHPIINNEKCIGCLACEKSCPVLTPKTITGQFEEPIVYAAWNKDTSIREISSSGGAFSALATTMINEGGYVAGAAYDDKMFVNHVTVDSIDGLEKLRGSKYVQCSINDNYKEVRQRLTQGKQVLFVGTPCQIAGLRSFLKKDYENLVCCDFICHGVPSPLLFKSYLEWLEKEHGCKINSFTFRSKRSGWYDALRVANSNIVAKGKYDAYFLGFNRNVTLRESCYNCPSNGVPRKGDITIADYWGIGRKYKFLPMKEIEKGVSLIMINNEKGKIFFNKSKKLLVYNERVFEEALAGNAPMVKASRRPKGRDTFYTDFGKMNFDTLAKKYFNLAGKAKIIAWLRENAPKSIVVTIRSISQYITYKKNGSQSL